MRKILHTIKYGLGWVTQNQDLPLEAQRFMLEYSPLIEHIENGGEVEEEELVKNENGKYIPVIKSPIVQQMVDEMQKRWPGIEVDTYSAKNLGVTEVPSNCSVQITEYDGRESIKYSGEIWL